MSFIKLILLCLLPSTLIFADSDKEYIEKLFKQDDPAFVEFIKKGKRYSVTYELLYACGQGKYNIVKSFIDDGVSVNSKDETYTTPLHNVASISDDNHLKIAQFLIDNGAKINAKAGINAVTGDKRKNTPLHKAVERTNNLPMVKLLVENGADINARNFENETPIFNALQKDNLINFNYLISKGAKINIKSRCDDKTLSHIAVDRINMEFIIILIANGANLNLKDSDKLTPLEYAKSNYSPRPGMIKILEKAQTPEVQALIKEGKKEEIIKILTELRKIYQKKVIHNFITVSNTSIKSNSRSSGS